MEGIETMPILKSSKKRLAKNVVQRVQNRNHLSAMRTAIKAVDSADDVDTARSALASAISTIDKTVRKGVVHRNTAARYKARLTKRVNSMS